MGIIFSKRALKEAKALYKNDIHSFKKLELLLNALQNEPLSSLGKPERLRNGAYSRKINKKDRLVYI